eukprot:gene411-745_t
MATQIKSHSIAFVDEIKRELMQTQCCKEISYGTKGSKIKLIDLSIWYDIVDENFIVSESEDATQISLVMERVIQVRDELWTWIQRYIAPKLVKITLSECNFTWKTVKKLFEQTIILESVIFRRNKWVNDSCIEYLSVKLAKTLRELNVEYSKITDDSLFHLGKRCQVLRDIYLDCCMGITDSGLFELSRRIHLSTLHIAHNKSITDPAIEKLLSNSHQLNTINLTNCPKLTDRTIAAFHESTVTWGKKRNKRSQNLHMLQLRDNLNFSDQIFNYISTAMSELVYLDLRDCVNIDLTKGLKDIETMKSLENLYLGPSSFTVNKIQFIDSLLYHIPNLRVLHLQGFRELIDDDVAEILENCVMLEEINLTNMNVGTKCIEAIASNIPNIARVTFIGSSVLSDAEIRCLTCTCVNIVELTLQNCPRLTHEAFSRCYALKFLTKLDLSRCSHLINGIALSYFRESRLTSLHLDGLDFPMRTALAEMKSHSYRNINEFSMREFMSATSIDVLEILCQCPFLSFLDLTDSDQLLPDMERLVHPNPFVSFHNDQGFMGFKADAAHLALRTRSQAILLRIREHRAARLMQKLRREYLERMARNESSLQLEYAKYHDSVHNAIEIQRIYRGWRCRKHRHRRVASGKAIVKLVYRFVHIHLKQQNTRMEAFRRMQLMKKCYRALYTATYTSRMELITRANKINPVLGMRLQKSIFGFLKSTESLVKDAKIMKEAEVIWEGHIMQRLVRAWRTLIGETSTRNTLLVKIFMNTMDLKYHNSTRQHINTRMADHFCTRRIICYTWLALKEEHRLVNVALRLIPIAEEHFDKIFFTRIFVPCFKALVQHALQRRRKHIQFARAVKYTSKRSSRKGLDALKRFKQRFTLFKLDKQTATLHHQMHLKRVGWALFGPFIKQCIVNKKCMKDAKMQYLNYTETLALHRFGEYVLRVKTIRHFTKIAIMRYRRNVFRGIMKNWRGHVQFIRHRSEYCKHIYNTKFKQKIILELKKHVQKRKDYRNKLRQKLMQQSEDEDSLNRFISAIISLQCALRVRIAQKIYAELRSTRLWAAQIIQCFFRKCLARKELNRRRRLFELNERAKEEAELDLMRHADTESAYYEYCIQAIIDFQRLFRGWKGRKYAKECAIVKSREDARKRYEAIEAAREKYEQEQREYAYKMRIKIKAATKIQAQIRGVLARMHYIEVLRLSKMDGSTIKIQRMYRRHLGKLMLEALKRDRVDMARYRAARRQRGLVFRLMGIRKRRGQNIFSNFLNMIGLEPYSFHYRISEIMGETMSDFVEAMKIARREMFLLRKYRGEKVPTLIGRKQYLIDKKVILEREDAVRVVMPGHKYFGYTGIVVRIDYSIPGNPLYEVKLDHFSRQTYVQMTRNAFDIYYKDQPLTRIERFPQLRRNKNKSYLINAITFFSKESYDKDYTAIQRGSVEVIQRAYRLYRSRKIADRKRFEYWNRAADKHSALLMQLSLMNATTQQAFNVAGLLRLRTHRPVLYEEIRPEVFPPRITYNGRHVNPKATIRREFYERYRQRLDFLERAIAHDRPVFSKGHIQITTWRKFPLFLNYTYGLMSRSKNGVSVSDVRGGRGARLLSASHSFVTGLNTYYFEQFEGSPHIRFPKATLYQGEWSGIPLLTKLKPHGDGLAVFFDCWGFAREDKVLQVTVHAARHLLAKDITSSDPYVEILCNGKRVQSTIKYANLNPVYHEYFEIDVTDPYAHMILRVMDYDYIGVDDFLGQIQIYLTELPWNETVRKTYLLKGRHLDEEELFDRGEIDLELKWTDRFYEDDFLESVQKVKDAIRLQAWARRIIAQNLRTRLKNEYDQNFADMIGDVITMQSLLRMRLARKEFKKRIRQHRAVIRVQTVARIWLAKRILQRLRNEKNQAIILQLGWLCSKARTIRRRLWEARQQILKARALVIQKAYRRKMAYNLVKSLRIEKRGTLAFEDQNKYGDAPVREWINIYGRDPDPQYKYRRIRRIVERVFYKIIFKHGSRLVTKIGDFFVKNYPPYFDDGFIQQSSSDSEVSEAYSSSDDEDNDDGRRGDKEEPKIVTNIPIREDFIECYVPRFTSRNMSLSRLMSTLDVYGSHTAYVNIPTERFMRKKTVEYLVISIQCCMRRYWARAVRRIKNRRMLALIRFQRAFKRHMLFMHKNAKIIQGFFNIIQAKHVVAHIRLERLSALAIQCAFRSWRARMALIDILSVKDITVLKFTSERYLHETDKCLDFRYDTFWMTSSKERAELRVEFPKKYAINAVWIMTGTMSASPKYVHVSCVMNKASKKYKVIVREEILPCKKGFGWHRLKFESHISKYFKITFVDNYGDEEGIAVRQIRFIIAKERSAEILKQPEHVVIEKGPPVGEYRRVKLSCPGDGWPLPSYQWCKDGQLLEGQNSSELTIYAQCFPTDRFRHFRCTKCKQVSDTMPFNAYEIVCGGCRIHEYQEMLLRIRKYVIDLNNTLKGLEEQRLTVLEALEDHKKALQLQQKLEKQEKQRLKEDRLLNSMGVKNIRSEKQNDQVKAESKGDKDEIGEENMSEEVHYKKREDMSASFLAFKENNNSNNDSNSNDKTKNKRKQSKGDGSGSNTNTNTPTYNNKNINSSMADAKESANNKKKENNKKYIVGAGAGAGGDNKKKGVESDAKETADDKESTSNQKKKPKRGSTGPGATAEDGDGGEGGDEESVDLAFQLREVEDRIAETMTHLEELTHERVDLKAAMEFANHFEGEGKYSCIVSNIRGGSVLIKRVSRVATVVFETIEPYVVRGYPLYIPRHQRKRQKWTLYSCVQGTFTTGRLEGIVTICYQEKAIYEGPYISEEWLDTMGQVIKNGRTATHWGVYTCADGRVFEGVNVDNHFDEGNIQGIYRLILTNGEIYEGEFCDERFHGHGIYKYVDGVVYEGQWHCNRRYGHGKLTGDGWTYDGQFAFDTKKGDGMISFDDGSIYIGEWQLDKYHGKGIFISRLHDVYRGEFQDGEFHGRGEIHYNNGSTYSGEFFSGKRHGKGLFRDRTGTEYFGTFIDDVKDGEFIVKQRVEVTKNNEKDAFLVDVEDEEVDLDIEAGYEIRRGIYDKGKFVEWTGHINNPYATQEFINLFEGDKRMFVGVYAMLIAKYLPRLPPGIDGKHPKVINILKHIRADGGLLIGIEEKAKAEDRVRELLPLITEAKSILDKAKADIVKTQSDILHLGKEISLLTIQWRWTCEQADKEFRNLEHFWLTERTGSRARFKRSVENLSTLITKKQWFDFKNERDPSHFLKKVMDAVSLVMNYSEVWTDQQMLCSDSEGNGLLGDREALFTRYENKLIFMLSKFDIYLFSDENDPRDLKLDEMLADSRFRRDSYYLESLGEPGPYLLDFVKATYAYIRAARATLKDRYNANEKQTEAARIKVSYLKKEEEQKELQNSFSHLINVRDSARKDLDDLKKELEKANGVLQYIAESSHADRKADHELEHYELMERKIEEREVHFAVEACVEAIIVHLEVKAEFELQTYLALSNNVPPEEKKALNITEVIEGEVGYRQAEISQQGFTLGYATTPEEYPITIDQTKHAIHGIVEYLILQMNASYNEVYGTNAWRMLDGRLLTMKFLYVLVWEQWRKQGIHRAEEIAVNTWESIFGDKVSCARMAVQSRVNWRMTEVVREQGKIWQRWHPAETEEAERSMAQELEEEFPENTGPIAIKMSEDESGAVPFQSKAASLCWLRLNPALASEARNAKNLIQANEFKAFFNDKTAENAFKILNGLCGSQDLAWADAALHWKDFNSEEYHVAEEIQITHMAAEFHRMNPKNTHIAAAKIIEEEILSKLILNEAVGKKLWAGMEAYSKARSWGTRNQGLLRTGTRIVQEEHTKMAVTQWNDLLRITEKFKKGSYLYLSEEQHMDPSLDRFYSFRQRQLRRFAWLYGYLVKHRDNMEAAIRDHDVVNPHGKIQHNMRPSEAKETREQEIKDHRVELNELETEYSEAISKLSMWHSYFGPAADEFQYDTTTAPNK